MHAVNPIIGMNLNSSQTKLVQSWGLGHSGPLTLPHRLGLFIFFSTILDDDSQDSQHVGSFKRFCDVAKVAIIQKNNLAIFGNILDKKVAKRKRNISIFLTTRWNLSYKFVIWKKKKNRNLANLDPFFPWKNLYMGENHIFQAFLFFNLPKMQFSSF